MKKLFTLLLLAALAGVLGSCSRSECDCAPAPEQEQTAQPAEAEQDGASQMFDKQ